ncbi:MAG: condensation domain-containing protein, partial [Segetibacter sp.]
YNTEIDDILLTSLSTTIANWSNSNKVLIGLEGHGRGDIAEGVDTTNTVGWFTTLYPVLLNINADNSSNLIKSIKEQLRQVPDQGVGYGVLKYINKEESLQGKQPWEILYNYLGQVDNLVSDSKYFSRVDEYAGENRAGEHTVNEKISINAIVRGGELVIKFDCSSKHFKELTVREIAENFITNLNFLISHCLQQDNKGGGLTPSDFGMGSKISIEELDELLEEEGDSRDNILSF